MDITITKHVFVEAESEEQAREAAMKLYKEDPFSLARNPDAVIDAEITDADKTEEDEVVRFEDLKEMLRFYWEQDVDEEGYQGSFTDWLVDNESEVSRIKEFYHCVD